MHVGSGCMLYAKNSVAKHNVAMEWTKVSSTGQNCILVPFGWDNFVPAITVLGQIQFRHAAPHYAQANLQTAGAEWTLT